MTAEDPPLEPPTPRPPGLLALMQGVLAAAIGVQLARVESLAAAG